jgi:hypothetical protein
MKIRPRYENSRRTIVNFTRQQLRKPSPDKPTTIPAMIECCRDELLSGLRHWRSGERKLGVHQDIVALADLAARLLPAEQRRLLRPVREFLTQFDSQYRKSPGPKRQRPSFAFRGVAAAAVEMMRTTGAKKIEDAIPQVAKKIRERIPSYKTLTASRLTDWYDGAARKRKNVPPKADFIHYRAALAEFRTVDEAIDRLVAISSR